MKITGQVAVVTGAASGIGQGTALALAEKGCKGIAVVDMAGGVADTAAKINAMPGDTEAVAFVGDTTNADFRRKVYDDCIAKWGIPRICVPAAGITRDKLSVKVDKETGRADLYSIDHFRLVLEVNLVAPTYWALEMVGRIAEARKKAGKKAWTPDEEIQGTAIFLGSVSSRGNRGQIVYSATKAGLVGVSKSFTMEAMFYGVRSAVVHPGFTDTPMVRAVGEDIIREHVLPHTQLKRLVRVEEIAGAICCMIENEAISGEVWADAGWHPAP